MCVGFSWFIELFRLLYPCWHCVVVDNIYVFVIFFFIYLCCLESQILYTHTHTQLHYELSFHQKSDSFLSYLRYLSQILVSHCWLYLTLKIWVILFSVCFGVFLAVLCLPCCKGISLVGRLSLGTWTSHCGGFSCGALAPGARGQ